jgi:intracellular multiplication protein IcmK
MIKMKNKIILAMLCSLSVGVFAQAGQGSSGVQVMGASSAQQQQSTQPNSGQNKIAAVANGMTDQMLKNSAPLSVTAPQYLPPVQPTAVGVQPAVSAYGTQINYNQSQQQPQPQQQNPIAQQNQQHAQPPTGLPELPTATANQAIYEAGLSLSPDEIRKLKKQIEEQGRAAAEDPMGRPPRSETNSVLVSLTPGSTPPVVRLYMNYPTSLVVVDNAGNPWPIDNWSGGSKQIEILRPTEKGPDGASISMTPRTPTGKFTYGGLSLHLKDLAIPIVITYVGGQPVVDQRVELRVQRRGPNTTTPTSFSVGPAANTSLLSLLDGVAPSSAKPLKVVGQAQVWDMGNGKMFVRTPLVVISPGYTSGMRSADGTNAYEMDKVSELRALEGGKVVSISIDY